MLNYRRLWHESIFGEWDVVARVHDWRLVRSICQKNPLKDILAFTESYAGSTPFCVQVSLPDGVDPALPPIDAVFELEVRRIGNKHSLGFSWHHRDGFALPSIYGTITARRFGPFVAVSMLGEYAKSTDAAGRLFDETLGSELAQRTLAEALGAICFILKSRAAVAAS